MSRCSETDAAASAAMLSAAAMIAHQVGGKATRDALFLSNFDVTSLPLMLIGASFFSIVVVLAASRAMPALTPAKLVPRAFAVSGLLLLGEWGLVHQSPRAGAVVVYLHMAGIGAVLISGFWSMVNERFDPRTAKKRIGRIAGGATLGGLAGGLLAERVGATFSVATMLPMMAALHLFCAWAVRGLRPLQDVAGPPAGKPAGQPPEKKDSSGDSAPARGRSVFHILREAPYLRNLAVLVLLATVSGAGIDYVFKAQAAATFGGGESLMRFFAVFYSAASLLTFFIQTSLSRRALEKLGLAKTVGTLPFIVAAGGVGALIAPGLGSAGIARGAESVVRSSLFRSGYEILYTPIPAQEKRATKTMVDVGFDRLGDALGGGLIRLMLLLGPAVAHSAILVLSIVLAFLGLLVASRLNRGYIVSLEKNLLNRKVELDISEAEDSTTRSTILQTLGALHLSGDLPALPSSQPLPSEKTQRRDLLIHKSESDVPSLGLSRDMASKKQGKAAPTPQDPVVERIAAFRSADADRVRKALRAEELLDPLLFSHVIPLLAWDEVSDDALLALRRAAPHMTGQLVDALLDPGQEFAIRRRIPKVLSVTASQRVADGLLLGLADKRFEVRFQCGCALASVRDRNPEIRIDPEPVFEAVKREVTVGKKVWGSHRLLDPEDGLEDSPFIDDFLRDRANRSLEHVFTILSLVLPKEPLQIAFRGLHTTDEHLRGTALEYLESILPPPIRERLWPFLEDRRKKKRETRSREEILATLMRSHQSIELNLTELRKKFGDSQQPSGLK